MAERARDHPHGGHPRCGLGHVHDSSDHPRRPLDAVPLRGLEFVRQRNERVRDSLREKRGETGAMMVLLGSFANFELRCGHPDCSVGCFRRRGSDAIHRLRQAEGCRGAWSS